MQAKLAHCTGSLGTILEQVSGESEDRQNKHSFSCQEMMLKKQDGFKKTALDIKLVNFVAKFLFETWQ